jgi:adenylate kinase family enzyme
VEVDRDDWLEIQRGLISGQSWIVDGNYGGTFDIRFARADTVIVLSLPRWRCVSRALHRTLRNYGKAIQAAGCKERVDLKFLRWVWRYPIDSRPRLDAALERHRGNLRVIELTSTDDARAFLERVNVENL